MSAARQPFDLTGPLPDGRLAIEASAGTGKTFTLAALAARYVAEQGVAASELLVVTFTRAATSELRGRIRERLASAATLLEGDGPVPADDPLLVHLASTDRAARQANLARAVTEFDAATIATIHGFATQALGTLGVGTGGDREAGLVDDVRDLQGEICADVLATAAVAGHPSADLPTLKGLVTAVEIALRTPDLVLLPPADEPAATSAQHLLRDLVGRVLQQIAAVHRRRGTRSFDDLLTELRRELGGANRDAVGAALRGRYRVALIDEFQDTDPVQWAIFSEVFDHAVDGSTLVLVGDPKQAIYSFRGADITTYVAATAPPTPVRSLATNYRSDGAVLQALDTVLRGATFGGGTIAFSSVGVAPGHEGRHLVDDRTGDRVPALSLRLAVGPDLGRTTRGLVTADDADAAVVADLAVRLRELLDHAWLPAEGTTPSRRVRPSDVAVLTRTAGEGEKVHAALVGQGVPAVLARGGSVLESPAADQWRVLLQALARPSDPRRARALALSWFGGRSAAWVADAPDEELAALQDLAHGWADGLARNGTDELVRRVWSESGVVARVLARPDGDRSATDLEHIAELLRTTTATARPGVSGLLAALDTDPEVEPDADVDGNVASRRIETEAQAVQVMTIWVAKGLEFPVVCCPSLWRKKGGPVIFHDPDLGTRAFDLGKGERWPDKQGAAARKRLAAEEVEGEDLRLLYVALTRARHHALVWWARIQGSEGSPLARVLFARHADGTLDDEAFTAAKVAVPDDGDALAAIGPLVARSGGTIVAGTHGVVPRARTRWVDPTEPATGAPLEVAGLHRVPDRSRARWSFTAITAGAEAHGPAGPGGAGPGAGGGGADEVRPGSDGSEEPEPAEPAESRPPADPAAGFDAPGTSPLASLPAGAAFGILVHEVLERVDPTAADLPAQLERAVDRELSWRRFDLTPVGPADATPELGRQLLQRGLDAALRTPLGPAFDGRTSTELGAGDRLTELPFELRLADGGGPATTRRLGREVLHHLPASDPFRPWAEELAAGAVDAVLAGHLNGSIDAVHRVRADGRAPRYVVVDYKTNRLHPAGRPPAAEHYAMPSLVASMVDHHYPLQALLYSVALHRYLRWRQPGYRPELHLGGVAYLYVRGMGGPEVAVAGADPGGVCTWAVPPALVVALSDLLHGRDGADVAPPPITSGRRA